MIGLQETLTLSQALSRMLAALDRIRDEIHNFRTDEPARRPAERVPLLMLSNLGNTQGKTPSVELHITGALIGGDTSGRGILQIGSFQIPIWITLNQANFLFLEEHNQIVVKNDRITWTPPGGTTNWDVVLFGHPRA